MNILEVRGVSKSFGKKLVLNNISLNIPKNSIYGLLGPNGAGKTTLIRIINQIVNMDSGEVIFNGKPITRNDVYRLGYLPEERGLYLKMKVGEHLIYMAQLKGMSGNKPKEVIRAYLKEFEILDWWNKKVEELSKGMQQKLQFIISIMHNPEFVILDEPFTGFDPINVELIKNKILELKANGTTFMFSTHRMETVEELCDYVTLIDKANMILDGKQSEIKKSYSKNIFEIDYKGSLKMFGTGLPAGFELVENKEEHFGKSRISFKLSGGLGINQILSIMLKEVEICSVNEQIPSMNDIFISLVNENTNE